MPKNVDWPSIQLTLFFLQASEQYRTCSQFLAQDFRQVISRLHVLQGLLGKLCLLPLNERFSVMVAGLSAAWFATEAA